MKNRLLTVVVVAAVLIAGLAIPRPAEAAGAFCHSVRPGENLSNIARSYGVSVDSILRANNLWNPNQIYAGQCLLIPGKKAAPKKCYKIHVVRRGEYLKLIGRRYGVSWKTLAKINGIRGPRYIIYPGQRLKIPKKCKPPAPEPPCPPPGPGGPWKGQYWNNRWQSGSPKWVTYYPNLRFNWGYGGPGDGIRGHNFSSRFTRSRYFDNGRYRFRVQVDDGVRVWLDGVLIIDKWHESGPIEYSTERHVGTGYHHLKVDYFQASGGARLLLYIERVGSGGTAWKCDFYNSEDLTGPVAATVWYGSLNQHWGRYSPAPGVNADYFTARCTANPHFNTANYQFKTYVDDGVRLFLDGHRILDRWTISAPRTDLAYSHVTAGTHELKVEFWEHTGGAVLSVNWTQH
jgi:LysM repeat protein